MTAVVSPLLSDLTSLAARVDIANGYPKPGVDIGAGIHVPPAQSVTTTWAAPFQHPTLLQFAYTVDNLDTSKLQASDKTMVQGAVTLTADWFPTSQAVGP